MSFLKRLNSPAPTDFSEPVSFKVLFFSWLFVFLFLGLLQPFGFGNIPDTSVKWLLAAGYGIITSLILLIYHLIFYWLFKTGLFKPEQYKVWHSIINILCIIILIGIGNYFFSALVFKDFPLSWHTFIVFLSYTLIMGIFPAIFIPYNNYYKQLKRNSQISEHLNLNTIPQKETTTRITIQSTLKDDKFSLPTNNILFFKAQGNYIQIIYSDEDNSVKKRMIRTTMKAIEENLKPHNLFLRVHRSFIVNKSKIVKSTGNAQGITLFFDNTSETVPVSRKYVPLLKSALN